MPEQHAITIVDFLQRPDSVHIFDVRKEAAFAESGQLIEGAEWRHPYRVDSWAGEVSAPVIVYCVHGHEVSQGVAAYLRARGLDARYLEGGFEAYVAAGGKTVSA
ncbi:MAG: rhodanese-like domain-containing protein [Rhodospirillales bacterium]